MSERPPWEALEDDTPAEVSGSSATVDTPLSSPGVSGAAAVSSESEDWMLGSGFDTDMEGDANPNQGNNLRFWMPKGAEKTIIFVTDGHEAPVLWEHSGQLNGSWRNWVSCLEPLGVPCPMCRYANTNGGAWRRYKGRFFTIIDCSEFTDKTGRARKNERRLLVAKKDTSEILKRKYLSRRDAGQKLAGAMFKVFRPPTDKSASVGEDFEFVKMVDLASFPVSADPNKEFLKSNGQFNLAELVKPDPGKMKVMYDRLCAARGIETSGGAPEGTDAKIPF